jgi:hypothetical protein
VLSAFDAGISAAEFDKAWNTFDASKAGSLRQKQLIELTTDLLGRVPNLMRKLVGDCVLVLRQRSGTELFFFFLLHQLKRVNPKADRAALDKMVRKRCASAAPSL